MKDRVEWRNFRWDVDCYLDFNFDIRDPVVELWFLHHDWIMQLRGL